jgi:hypothetical protein
MANNNIFADDSWPDSLFEPSINSTTFFSGVRVAVVDGIAHLMFYQEQPSTDGRTEFIVLARMMSPVARGPPQSSDPLPGGYRAAARLTFRLASIATLAKSGTNALITTRLGRTVSSILTTHKRHAHSESSIIHALTWIELGACRAVCLPFSHKLNGGRTMLN